MPRPTKDTTLNSLCVDKINAKVGEFIDFRVGTFDTDNLKSQTLEVGVSQDIQVTFESGDRAPAPPPTALVKGLLASETHVVKKDLVVGKCSNLTPNDPKPEEGGNAWICRNLKVFGDTELCGNLTVLGNVDFPDVITDDLELSGNLVVQGTSELCGDVHIKGDLQVDGDSNVNGNSTVEGDLQVNGNETVNGDSKVEGNQHICGDLEVCGETCLDCVTAECAHVTTLDVEESVCTQCLHVEDNAHLAELEVCGDSKLEGDLSVDGAVSAGELSVAGDSALNNVSAGDLSLSGLVVLSSGAVEVAGNATTALPVNKSVLLLSTTGSELATATLADGVTGQLLQVLAEDLSAGANVLLVPANPLGFANVALNNNGASVQHVFGSSAWAVTSSHLAVVN